jgi:tubulin-specific chaperone A
MFSFRRLLKEVSYYEFEVEENKAKLERMENEGKDPYDVKKFKEVLDESLMMIPDSKRRLHISLDELCMILDAHDFPETDDNVVQEARSLLQTNNYPQHEKNQVTHVEDDADAF